MGIYNRDYYRDEAPYRSDWQHSSPQGLSAVGWIILVTAGVYIVQLAAGRRFDLWFSLDPAAVLNGQVWRLISYDFLHDRRSPLHILINMYMLYMTGRDLEVRRGSREFVAFYLLAGLLEGLVYVVWDLLMSPGNPSDAIGASGAVMAVIIIYAMNYPHQTWLIFGIVPVPVWAIVGLMVIFDLHPLLLELSGEETGDHVAHAAHVGGMIFGALYWRNNWRVLDWLPALSPRGMRRWFDRRPQLRVHRETEPDPADFDQRVDELLDKVAREGEASLTAKERSILIEASRRARSRRAR